MQVSDKYILIQQIGSGSFGEVYLAEDKHNNYVAIKVEDKKKIQVQKLCSEYKIYEYLKKFNFNVGLPKTYEYFQSNDYNFMVMQLLGPSLEDLFNQNNQKFKLSTVFMLANQLLYLLQQLHSAKYIHRDIKPNNFLIGSVTNSDTDQLYMMDFGLSKKYINNNKHIVFRNGRSLIGTARYASCNMHMGIEPTRRDDLESVGYMLIYFIKGVLPWQGIKKEMIKTTHFESIGNVKLCTSLDKLCEGIPESFKLYLKYCKGLKFDETPNYEYLRGLFVDDSIRLKIIPYFEWNQI
jgi:serine/threonine protein kinase